MYFLLQTILVCLIFKIQIFPTSAVASTELPEVPPYLNICHKNDSNLNDCIKKSIDALKPYLKSGIPELLIPSCEPLVIRKLDIGQAAGPVSVNSSYTNIKITGASDFHLQTIKLDTSKNRIKLKISIPSLSMKSDYSVKGRIIMIPVTGKGKFSGNFTEIDALVMVQGEQYKNPKTQKKHFRVIEFYIDIDIGNSSIHLDNLFNGDKTLADAMNVFLNENWKIVAAEIKPALENSIANLFQQFANKIFDKYPLDTLLPL